VSQENIEVIRRAAEAFNQGGREAARRFFADDAEFHEAPESPSPRLGRGIEEAEKLFGAFEDTWAEHRTEIEEIRAVGKDRVLVFSVEHFRGRDGIELTAPAGSVFTLRKGKITRWQTFWDRQRALEAAGLKE
jgi:ketosteroid isomerase-like protein